jgi:tripartite-type tricarboxylate transporter receptor subunit TctC
VLATAGTARFFLLRCPRRDWHIATFRCARLWPARGAGPAVQGLLGGDVHMMFVDYATARSHIAAGTHPCQQVT